MKTVEELLPNNFIEYDPDVDDDVVNIEKMKEAITQDRQDLKDKIIELLEGMKQTVDDNDEWETGLEAQAYNLALSDTAEAIKKLEV